MILIETQKEEFSKLKDIRIFGKKDEESSFNGDLLVIGLGGLGSQVVCKLKGMLIDDIKPEDNINFMMIDSDIPAMEQTIEDSKEGLGLNAMEVISIYRPNMSNILTNGIGNTPAGPDFAKWMRRDFPNISIGTDGARGNRQIGRLMFSNAYEDMRILLFEKIEEIYQKSETGKLDVILISSIAGGTGSGILADVSFNIRAFAKSKKWTNFRVGGCLLTPDVLYSHKSIVNDQEKMLLMNANGCATLKEVDYLMRIANRGEGYVFETNGHRLSIKENIFDACMLVSGKKDDQGYIPEHIICSDVAYFLVKLASNKYIGGADEDGNRKLLRDTFFDHEKEGYFKIVNESDYKIPIKEIENICECDIYKNAVKLIMDIPNMYDIVERDMAECLKEITDFMKGAPGEEVNININGLIKPAQYEKPSYKLIKKGMDDLRTEIPRQLSRIEQDIPIYVKSIKNKLCQALDQYIEGYMKEYGPVIALRMIGAKGYGNIQADTGMIACLKSIEGMEKNYHPTGEYERVIESILDIVAHRFFTFPSAKRETENGYYENCMKNAMEKERTLIMDGIDSGDVIGDSIRLLRQRAEHLDEVYSSFGSDLDAMITGLADNGRRTAGYLLKGAKQSEFLPSDYVTDTRIKEFRKGVVNFLIDHEADIDAGRPVTVKQDMEKIYKTALIGLGAYAPEKLITVAFADEVPTLAELNMMFVSPTNEKRAEIMKLAAKAFVEGAWEKTQKKQLCILKDTYEDGSLNTKYISLPEAMPYFSEAVKEILTSEPYNEDISSITSNAGEIEISVDDIFVGVPLSELACAKEMQSAYNSIISNNFYGIHTDEVTKDMRSYPDIC